MFVSCTLLGNQQRAMTCLRSFRLDESLFQHIALFIHADVQAKPWKFARWNIKTYFSSFSISMELLYQDFYWNLPSSFKARVTCFAMDSSYSPLVRHLLNSWWPVCQVDPFSHFLMEIEGQYLSENPSTKAKYAKSKYFEGLTYWYVWWNLHI